MGMFDDILCKRVMPDGLNGDGVLFQSKDFDCEMRMYEITSDGRLMRDTGHYEEVPLAERPIPEIPFVGSLQWVSEGFVDTEYHGYLNFYHYDSEREVLHDYNAKFTDGQLVEINAQENRRTGEAMSGITFEEIEKMQAGVDLDRLITQHVMGGLIDHDPEEFAPAGEVWFWEHPRSGVLKGTPYHHRSADPPNQWAHSYHKWNPSTDIAAAWEVVEKMRAQWFFRCDEQQDGSWWVGFTPRYLGIDDQPYGAVAQTLPLGICRAALKACLNVPSSSSPQSSPDPPTRG